MSNRLLLPVLILCAVIASAQTMRDRVGPRLEKALAAGSPFVSVSAASGAPAVAPGSLASIFGPNLSARTDSGGAPYPASMDGVAVQVVDSANVSRTAQLLYVSPGQINFLMPAGLAPGQATLTVTNGGGAPLSSTVSLQAVAPAIFTANGDGTGVVAATASRTVIPTQISSPVAVFRCGAAPGSCVSVPIDPGVDAPVTVTIYATGLRGRSSDSAVKLTIGGVDMPLSSIKAFDDSSPLAGVDEVTFSGLLAARGVGETDIQLTVDGVRSNTARIDVQ